MRGLNNIFSAKEKTEWNLTLLATIVFARCRLSAPTAACLFNKDSLAFNLGATETVARGVSLVNRDHLDKAEATRLLGVRVHHNFAFFYVAILLEETLYCFIAEGGAKASDEKVGSRVKGALVLSFRRGLLRGSVVGITRRVSKKNTSQ